MQEVEKYKQDEEKGVTSKAVRENNLMLTANCLLNVIEMGCDRKPRLNIDLVLHHCLMALKDSFLVDKFARNYLTALNRIILPVRKYWSQLKPNLWLSLFLLTLKILKNARTPPNVTLVSLASLLNLVIHRGAIQSDLSLKMGKKIPFFIESLNNKNMMHKEHHLFKIWLDTSIHLAFSVGQQDRYLLCNLTENTLNTVLDCCHEKTDVEIELVVQYSIVAMIAHHPFGVQCGEPGFFVSKSLEEWQQILRRLFSLTDFIIKNMNQRNQTAENRNDELNEQQISLAVRVARQMFAHVSDEGDECLPPTKKKRTVSGLQEIIDRLKSNGAVSSSIPWLQVINELIRKNPQLIQRHELKELILYVVDITEDCRVYSLITHCYRLFRTIIFIRRKDVLLDVNIDHLKKLWQTIWKCIGDRQCLKEGFFLLASLIHFHLVPASVARNLIDQLTRKAVACSYPSMICLAVFLNCYKLPEFGADDLKIHHRSIKSSLIEWLLGRAELNNENDYEAIRMNFLLLNTLALQQPAISGIGRIDGIDWLNNCPAVSHFDVQCIQLEEALRYGEFMDADTDEVDGSVSVFRLTSGENGYQLSTVEDIFERTGQLCTDASKLFQRMNEIGNGIYLLSFTFFFKFVFNSLFYFYL